MRKKDEIIWIMPIIFIFIILFMIKFCTPKINQKYVIEKITRENLELFVDMKGTVVANNVTKIGLDVNLSVDDVYYRAGDFVKKGDVIVKFSDYQKNGLNEKHTLLVIKNRELRNLEKQKELGSDVSQKIQELRGEISGLEIEINDEMKNTRLVQRSVRSPFDAYIVKINAVKGGITNKNEPILILAKREDLKIVSESVKSDKVKNLKIGNVAKINIFRRENKKIGDMNVFEFLPILFKDLFLNEQVNIRVIYKKKENILAVPKKAVIFKNQKSYIYLIDKNNLVKEKEVFIGTDNGEKIEIFGMDIGEGMEIIGNPDDKIGNNVIVERRNIKDEEIEKKKKLERLERENEKLGNRMDENEREIIRLKRK